MDTIPSRKPAIYLAVIVPLLLGGNLLVCWCLLSAYAASRGQPISAIYDGEALLLTLPGFALGIPLYLLIANGILYAVTPLRRIAERHTAATRRPGFRQSQRQLLVLFAIAATICVPIIACVFLFGR
jgi:hypothetical protein